MNQLKPYESLLKKHFRGILFNVNVNASLKFLRALGELSDSTWALGGHSGTWGTRAPEHSEHSDILALGHLGHFRHSGTWTVRVTRHWGSQVTRIPGHFDTQAL